MDNLQLKKLKKSLFSIEITITLTAAICLFSFGKIIGGLILFVLFCAEMHYATKDNA